ncbi:uncharacterized protein LOC101858890 [Aplysia californica]|uniref:Uncharacterized protein LOC101858890 n=1 Tax=Aplysia californica TaxID=6500 RepID=A0ABM0K2V3_APLCA|nr:uncharacterized protein LOC101858890 [Aplysia californica]
MAEVQNVDPVMEKPWQRAKRFQKYDFFRKSAFPPMQIEPFQDERARLAGEGMTPEQRALRKQWVKDQILHHEPRSVPQLQPYNIFRRIYRFPADVLIYGPAQKFVSKTAASVLRYTVPKMLMTFGGAYLLWYHLKYNQNDWTRSGGWVVYFGKPTLVGEGSQKQFVEKQATDYFDRGFKSRKALMYQDPEP